MKSDCISQLLDYLSKDREKLNRYLGIYEKWLKLKNAGRGICQFIQDKGFERVAVYGAGYLGRSLYNELKDNGINDAYLIDRNRNASHGEYSVYALQDELPETDVVIITPVISFDEIVEGLEGKMDCPLLSLEDIISLL